MGVRWEISSSRPSRVLENPFAFVATATILVALYGWTFFANPGRPAPADDPAYGVWRTEALLVHPPATVMTIDGPDGMHSTGYRVTTPVVAAVARRVLSVDRLTPSVVLAVGCRVTIALLLAGLVYLHVRVAALWHVVVLGSGSILLTPPFGGYTDNMVALAFVTASLYLLDAVRTRWAPRIAFTGLLTAAGLTHPTTLAIFCGTLVLLAVLRALLDGDRRPYEILAAAAAVGIVLITWRFGIWGPGAPLREAALPPPGTTAFFKQRLEDWLTAIRPLPNAVLVGCGIAGLSLWRRPTTDGLTRLSLAWLAPLIGVLGVVTGLAYPYYRFLNATLAWVLLLGVGAYVALRAFLRFNPLAAALGIAAVGAVIVTNYAAGLSRPTWNDPDQGWITRAERRDLDSLYSHLDNNGADEVIFVVDHDAHAPLELYGFVKRAGNVARYGVPAELQDRITTYLGTVDNLLADTATPGPHYYEMLSQATLEEVDDVGPDDVVVIPEVFNPAGINAEAAVNGPVHYLADGRVSASTPDVLDAARATPSRVSDWARIIIGAILILLPGVVLTRALLPKANVAYAGFAITIGSALLAGVVVLLVALTRDPVTPTIAWGALIACNAIAALVGTNALRARGRPIGDPA